MSGVGEDREQTQQRVRITANWRLLERRLTIVRVRANQKSRMRCLTVPVSSTPSNLVESDGGNHFHHPLDSAGNARSARTVVGEPHIRQTVFAAIWGQDVVRTPTSEQFHRLTGRRCPVYGQSCHAVTTVPSSKQYHANQCSLRCVTIRIRNRSATMPTANEITAPNSSCPIANPPDLPPAMSIALSNTAPPTAGTESRNENVVAACRVTPIINAPAIVLPERETPGSGASA